MRSPLRNTSRGSISSRRTIASPRPRSTTTLPYSTRLTMPLTTSPIRSLYSWYCRLRGDAPVFERRQRVRDGVADLRGGIVPAGILQADLACGILHMLDHQQMPGKPQLAGLGIDVGVDVGLAAVARARSLGDRVLHGGDHDAAVDRLLAGNRVGDLQQL